MTDPQVEFPHEDESRDHYSPRLYDRYGAQITEAEFEQVWADHGVAYSTIRGKNGVRSVVSTIFLGLDHGFMTDEGGPILYETAVFEPAGLLFRTRSRTEAEARTAHASALIDLVAAIETSTPDDPFPALPAREPTPSSYVGLDPEEGTPADEQLHTDT